MTKQILFLDSETFSTIDLKKHGHDRYKDEVEVMLITYARGMTEPVRLWDLTAGEPMPGDLHEAIYDTENWVIASHNQPFDMTMILEDQVFPGAVLTDERWFCTMVQALAHGLPAGLDALCQAFGISEDKAKLKDGRKLIHLFCKLRNGKRTLPTDAPLEWERFKDYAKQDITAMREVYRLMPKWSYPGSGYLDGRPSPEFNLWLIDRIINRRGLFIDQDLCRQAVTQAKDAKTSLNQQTYEATGGVVSAATQRDALLHFILSTHGIPLPDMRADTLRRRIEDPNLPPEVKHLLELRIASGRNASSKYAAAMNAVGLDGRLRNTLQFCGAASTGRWAGRIFQPQNMMRPTMKGPAIMEAIEDIRNGSAPYLWDNLVEVLGNSTRGVLIAPEGKKLIATDLGSIESRGLAFLSGEERVLEFFRGYDRGDINYDGYMLAYADAFGIDPATVGKDQRQIGKPIDLAHGYGGGVAAFLTFAMTYGLDLQELATLIHEHGDPGELRDCNRSYEYAKEKGWHGGLPEFLFTAFEYIKRRWRRAHPKTVVWWNELAEAFDNSCWYDKTVFTAGMVKFRRDGHWTRIQLPSGRFLTMLQAKSEDGVRSFAGLDRYTRRWSRQYTHGGKLAGIVTQSFASCILRAALPELEAEGYHTVLTVHDEVITEVPDTPEYTVQRQVAIMTRQRHFTKGLPLVADGFEAYRYRKDD